jgi:hypothetical protein
MAEIPLRFCSLPSSVLIMMNAQALPAGAAGADDGKDGAVLLPSAA